MKTQITKENALIILENAVKQESLLQSLERLMDAHGTDFDGSVTVLNAIFNIDPMKMEQEEYDKYWNAYFNVIEEEGTDYAKKAEKIYNKVLKLTLKEEKQSIIPGVINILSGKNYRIEGEFGLQT